MVFINSVFGGQKKTLWKAVAYHVGFIHKRWQLWKCSNCHCCTLSRLRLVKTSNHGIQARAVDDSGNLQWNVSMLPIGVLEDGDVKYCKDTVVSSNCGIIPPTRVVCKYGGLCRAVWPCLPPAQHSHTAAQAASDHHHHRDRDHHHRRHHHHHHHYLHHQNLNFRSQSSTC